MGHKLMKLPTFLSVNYIDEFVNSFTHNWADFFLPNLAPRQFVGNFNWKFVKERKIPG